jgi:hypothetical protein
MKEADRQDAKWNKVSLGIYGEPLEPERITELLGLTPTRWGRKGEIRISPRAKVPPRKNSFWLLSSPLADSEPLDAHLSWLMDKLEPKRQALEELAKEYKVQFVCGFSSENGQGGCTFDPRLLNRLSSLGLPLVLDLYPPGPIPDQDQTLGLL